MKRSHRTKLGCLVLAVVLFFCGCSHLGKKKDDMSASEMVAAESQAPTSSYMDFGDILIPYGLKVDSKSTFIIRSSGLTAGVLVLKGRVDEASLVNFFEANMIKDNWRLISSFKSPRTLILYRKDTRWCVINVSESGFTTHVEIWVSPSLDNPNTGLLK